MPLFNRIALATAASVFAIAAQAAKVGDAAPNFTLPGHDGKPHSLSDFKGKTVVQALQKTYTGKDVVSLSVNSSAPGKQGHVDAASATKIVQEKGAAPTLVLLDGKGEVGKLYEAKTTPHMFVIDKAGKLAYAGGIDSEPSADPADVATATPYVKNALDELLAGKPVTTAVTKPYGCSIKYAG